MNKFEVVRAKNWALEKAYDEILRLKRIYSMDYRKNEETEDWEEVQKPEDEFTEEDRVYMNTWDKLLEYIESKI